MAAFCDLAAPLLGAVIAALLVLRVRWRWLWLGFPAGFFVFWAFEWLRVELLYYFDPERDAGVFDAVVVAVISPILAFAWCVLCLLGRLFCRFYRPVW